MHIIHLVFKLTAPFPGCIHFLCGLGNYITTWHEAAHMQMDLNNAT